MLFLLLGVNALPAQKTITLRRRLRLARQPVRRQHQLPRQRVPGLHDGQHRRPQGHQLL